MHENDDLWDDPATCLHPLLRDRDQHCIDCGADAEVIRAEHRKVHGAFRAAGFVREHTGGGSAYVRRSGDTVTVVTADGLATAPALWCEACHVEHGGCGELDDPTYGTTCEVLARYL